MKKTFICLNVSVVAILIAVFMFGRGAVAQESGTVADATLKTHVERNDAMRSAMQEKMKSVSEAERKLTERRNVVLTENQAALALSAEILEMENAVKAKRNQLNAIVEQDAEFALLKSEVTNKREEITALRKKFSEDMAEEHRKRRESEMQK